MAKIHVLDNSLINKIAAGEVVERPASVVKELVENSIDAGAANVAVEIQNGGISLIKITDNGRGIPADEIETAFLRHATSKLNTFDELGNIMTLGFRGEALSSIASVAQVEMITKTNDDEAGTKICLEGGKITEKQPCAATTGTVFTVRNLFFNTPARRKFLKKPSAESGHVSDAVYRIALGHPEVSIKFVNNGSTVFQTNGNGDLSAAVLYLYGKDMAQSLVPVSLERDGYRISGLIAKPELNRGNRSYENFFINGRYIKSSLVSRAVEDAYKGRLMVGKFPVFMLDLSVPPNTVDVNVHPTKLEVRFQNENFIYDLLYSAVFNTLKKLVLIPKTQWDAPKAKPYVPPKTEEPVKREEPVQIKEEIPVKETAEPIKTELPQKLVDEDMLLLKEPHKKGENADLSLKMMQAVERIAKSAEKEEKQEEKSEEKNTVIPEEKPVSENKAQEIPPVIQTEEKSAVKPHEQQDFLDKIEDIHHFFNNYKIVGQLFNTYWIVEQGDSMYMIDQHAAHERALYEEILAKLAEGEDRPVSQLLLQPIAINVTAAEAAVIEDNRELLENFGFDVEPFGANAYALRAVPYILKEPSNAGFFTEILDMLKEQPVSTPYQARLDAIATMSCKAAVKGHDKLSYSEAKELIERILKLENPFSCPHGRPTIIEMSKYELEKKFKRIQ